MIVKSNTLEYASLESIRFDSTTKRLCNTSFVFQLEFNKLDFALRATPYQHHANRPVSSEKECCRTNLHTDRLKHNARRLSAASVFAMKPHGRGDWATSMYLFYIPHTHVDSVTLRERRPIASTEFYCARTGSICLYRFKCRWCKPTTNCDATSNLVVRPGTLAYLND